MSVRHLYVHVPFCAHRCGYCDFVTVTGHDDLHAAYVDALLAELDLHGPLAPETVYVGGGTPSLLPEEPLARLLTGLPACADVTIECNPETITQRRLARLLLRVRRDTHLARGPELPAPAARDTRAAGAPGDRRIGGRDPPRRRATKTSTST